MITTLLQALERDPNRVFYERDLERFPAAELEFAADKRLLHGVPRGSSYKDDAGRTLLLVDNADGTFEAIDEDDPEADPISLTASDLRRWQLDLIAVAEEIRARNQLSGPPERIDDGLIFVGDARRDGLSIAVVLGLISGPRSAMRQLRVLPTALPPSCDRIVVACPSFTPSPSQRRELESLDVHIVPLGVDDLGLDLATAMARPTRQRPRVILTDEEEREVRLHGFKSRLPIHITGKREPRGANVVEVAGQPVSVTDQPFKLFMRLVVASFEKPNGYVARGSMGSTLGLAAEGYYHPEGMEQAIDRLRRPFRGALNGLKANDLIEVQHGMVRLSAHPRYVTWDSEALLGHHDPKIRSLTMRLDKAARARAGSA